MRHGSWGRRRRAPTPPRRTAGQHRRATSGDEATISRRVGILGGLGLLGPAFVAITFAAGIVRPGYSVLRDEVSELALGAGGWLQTASFAVFGVLLVAFAIGLRAGLVHDAAARRGGLMLAVAGVGLAALAAFPTDASYRHPTLRGGMHFGLYTLTVTAFVASIWCFARAFSRDRRWRGYVPFTRLTGVAALAVFVAVVAFGAHGPGDRTEPLSGVTGGLERGLIIVLSAWVVVVAQRHVRLAFRPAVVPTRR